MTGEDLFLTMQRQVIAVLAHRHLSDEPGTRQALLDGLRWLGGSHQMAFALWTSIGAADVFTHEERCGNVVELFTDLFADRFTDHLALGTLPLFWGQFVAVLFTTQGRWKLTPTGRRDLLRRGCWFSRNRLRQRGKQVFQLGEQGIGLGIELLATRAVQTTQQLVELLLQIDIGALFAIQRVEEFDNHLLENSRVIRQRRDIRSDENILAHALYYAREQEKFHRDGQNLTNSGDGVTLPCHLTWLRPPGESLVDSEATASRC